VGRAVLGARSSSPACAIGSTQLLALVFYGHGQLLVGVCHLANGQARASLVQSRFIDSSPWYLASFVGGRDGLFLCVPSNGAKTKLNRATGLSAGACMLAEC